MTSDDDTREGDDKKVRVSVSFPPDHYAELQRIAAEKKVSVAWVVRDAVELYLTRAKDAKR
jgi:metal-responsive CopG/Arc/MetJ family transcriptional regulator